MLYNKSMNIKLILKRIVTNKLFLSLIAIAIIVGAGYITYLKVTTINDAERVALDEFTNRVMPYLDEVDYDGEDKERTDDNYIAFALEYNFGENGKNEMSINDIDKLIKDTFNYSIGTSELEHGISTPRLINKYISYSDNGSTFTLDRSRIDKQLITSTPITKYIEQSATKSGGNFVVKYAKYQFDTPYKILDCAAQNNISIPNFDSYIEGKASSVSLKRAMNQTCTDKDATRLKEITVTFVAKDGRLYIKEIK